MEAILCNAVSAELFVCNERNFDVRNIFFNRHFRGLYSFLSLFPNRVVGTYQICYHHHCPSPLTVLQLAVHTQTLITESPLDDHDNTERH
jgi:hypothetical protein